MEIISQLNDEESFLAIEEETDQLWIVKIKRVNNDECVFKEIQNTF